MVGIGAAVSTAASTTESAGAGLESSETTAAPSAATATRGGVVARASFGLERVIRHIVLVEG